MTEVLKYATEEQAEEDFDKTFDKNNEVIDTLESRFGELSDVSRWKEVGEQYEVDCVLQLKKVAGKYSYSGGVRNQLELPNLEPHSTLEELVKGIKKRFIVGGAFFGMYGVYGINVNPLFYNIIGVHELPFEGREEMKDFLRYSLDECKNEEDKEQIKNLLKTIEQPDVYKIEGLTPEEIAEFVRLYDAD